MLFEAIFAGLIVGKLRGGRFSSLKSVDIKYFRLLLLAFFIDLLTPVISSAGYMDIGNYAPLIQITRYGLVFAFIAFNMKYKALWITGFGSLLNFTAIMANGGKMPVSPYIIKFADRSRRVESLIKGNIPTYRILDENTRLGFLGDIIPFRHIVNEMLSFGDIIMAVGLFLLVQEFMAVQHRSKHPLNPI